MVQFISSTCLRYYRCSDWTHLVQINVLNAELRLILASVACSTSLSTTSPSFVIKLFLSTLLIRFDLNSNFWSFTIWPAFRGIRGHRQWHASLVISTNSSNSIIHKIFTLNFQNSHHTKRDWKCLQSICSHTLRNKYMYACFKTLYHEMKMRWTQNSAKLITSTRL